MDQTAAASNPDERPIRPAASSWEERPIRPAASASWDEEPIRPPENCASSTAAPPAENTNPHTAVLRPAFERARARASEGTAAGFAGVHAG